MVVMKFICAIMMMMMVENVSGKEPSIEYHLHEMGLGNYSVVTNWTLPLTDSFITIPAQTQCQCVSACWTHLECVAVAVAVDDNGDKQCRLATHGPLNTNDHQKDGDTYIFWHKTLPKADYFWTLGDHFSYILPLQDTMTFFAARDFCNGIPRHRLTIIKTEKSLDVARSLSTGYGKHLWIDLVRKGSLCGSDNTKDLFWGDDTPYQLNERPFCDIEQLNMHADDKYVIRLDGLIGDRRSTQSFLPLCQANPFNEQW